MAQRHLPVMQAGSQNTRAGQPPEVVHCHHPQVCSSWLGSTSAMRLVILRTGSLTSCRRSWRAGGMVDGSADL